jgi:hypothetical protein
MSVTLTSSTCTASLSRRLTFERRGGEAVPLARMVRRRDARKESIAARKLSVFEAAVEPRATTRWPPKDGQPAPKGEPQRTKPARMRRRWN